MKKLIIATSILFAFSATFAQEGKPSKKTPMSSKAPTSVSSNEAKPNMKPNVKPVGKTSTKPAPVVSKVTPSKGTNPVGPSSNRSSRSAVGTVNEKTPIKVETKSNSTISKSRASKSAVGTVNEKTPTKVETKDNSTISKSRASKSAVGTVNEKTPTKVETKDNSTISKSRASKSAVGTVNEKTPTKVETKDNSTISKSRASKSAVGTVNEKTPTKVETKDNSTISKSRASESAVGTNNQIELKKPDADYCKGWKEGYIKAFSKATGKKISSSDVPSCVVQGNCEGYKCGYAAGIRNAERRIK